MYSDQYQHDTNDNSNRDNLANERCVTFFDLRLHKRSHCVIKLGHW